MFLLMSFLCDCEQMMKRNFISLTFRSPVSVYTFLFYLLLNKPIQRVKPSQWAVKVTRWSIKRWFFKVYRIYQLQVSKAVLGRDLFINNMKGWIIVRTSLKPSLELCDGILGFSYCKQSTLINIRIFFSHSRVRFSIVEATLAVVRGRSAPMDVVRLETKGQVSVYWWR